MRQKLLFPVSSLPRQHVYKMQTGYSCMAEKIENNPKSCGSIQVSSKFFSTKQKNNHPIGWLL